MVVNIEELQKMSKTHQILQIVTPTKKLENNSIGNSSFCRMTRTIRIYFYLNCIIIITESRCSSIFDKMLLVIYNFLSFLQLFSQIICLRISYIGYIVLVFLPKVLSIFAWWIMYRRKKLVLDILQQVNCIRGQWARPKTKFYSGICLNLCVGLLLTSIFIPFILRTITFRTSSFKVAASKSPIQSKWRGKCRISSSLGLGQRSDFIDSILILLPQHLDWSIHFAIAVLYCLCCRELEQSIRILCAKPHHFMSVKIWQQYHSIRKCLKDMENCFSVLVFIFMSRSFVEFFRVLTFLLHKIKVNFDATFSVATAMHSCVILTVLVWW